MIGILTSISTVLSRNNISVFVVSTFDTDYILVMEPDLKKAVEELIKAGNKVSGNTDFETTNF